MTYQTEGHHASDRRRAGTALPHCRRLFTAEQAAEHAAVPVQMIHLWIAAGKLRAHRLDGGRRIDELDLADFLASAPKRA